MNNANITHPDTPSFHHVLSHSAVFAADTVKGQAVGLDGSTDTAVIGFAAKDVDAGYRGTIVTAGHVVVKAAPTVAIAVGDPLYVDADRNVTNVAGADPMVGYALDSSDGTSTIAEPHYISALIK